MLTLKRLLLIASLTLFSLAHASEKDKKPPATVGGSDAYVNLVNHLTSLSPTPAALRIRKPDYYIAPGNLNYYPRYAENFNLITPLETLPAATRAQDLKLIASSIKNKVVAVDSVFEGSVMGLKFTVLNPKFQEKAKVISAKLTNKTNMDINNFQGLMVITDREGLSIISGRFAVKGIIPANGSVFWEGVIRSDEYSESYANLHNNGLSITVNIYQRMP